MTSNRRAGLRVFALLAAVLLLLPLCACQSGKDEMQDGFYSAEAIEYDEDGWKEYVILYVSNGTIITVEYDAKNASGFIKGWDMVYMSEMNAANGTYPNKYAREYAEALLNRQNPDRVDVVAGATLSHASFQALVKAAIAQAYAGDENVAYVRLTEASEP